MFGFYNNLNFIGLVLTDRFWWPLLRYVGIYSRLWLMNGDPYAYFLGDFQPLSMAPNGQFNKQALSSKCLT